jgi:DNA modification methylase
VKPYYQDEAVTIYHGDCREIIPQLPLVGSVITDPPYGIAYESGWSPETRDHANSIVGDDTTELRDFVLNRFAKDVATACFATPRCVPPFPPVATLVWDKGEAAGMGNLAIPWKPNWEGIWIFGEGWSGHRGSSVLRGRIVVSWSRDRCHPNEKPVWLLAELIGKAPAGTVLDPFIGSGTTLRAAKDLGRKAIGIEIEEKYCEIAARRMAQEVLPL